MSDPDEHDDQSKQHLKDEEKKPEPGDSPTIKQRVTEKIDQARLKSPFVDHLMRMVDHYGDVKGNVQSGAVTFFGFLSFFPIMAMSFFVIGYVAKIYPDAQDALVEAIQSILPGMVTEDPPEKAQSGQISLETLQGAAAGLGIVGLLGVIYSGLGWLSGMREALQVVFELPQEEAPNFVVGKAKDLLVLATIGFTLILSVAITGAASAASSWILGLIGLGDELAPLLWLLGVVVGLLANMLLFFTIFRLLANPPAPKRSLWEGALLGAIGFEVLKLVATYLMASTKNQPAFQAFGIALILVVWINYFSRVVMYAASWAHTDEQAILARQALEAQEWAEIDETRPLLLKGYATVPADELEKPRGRGGAFLAGGAVGAAVVAGIRRKVGR